MSNIAAAAINFLALTVLFGVVAFELGPRYGYGTVVSASIVLTAAAVWLLVRMRHVVIASRASS